MSEVVQAKTAAVKKKQWLVRGVMVLLLALAIELIVCNISSWISLFYPKEIVFNGWGVEGAVLADGDSGRYVAEGGSFVIQLPEMDAKLKNIHYDLSFPGTAVVPYTITLSDEGNAYPYSLPEAYYIEGNERAAYVNLYSFGTVKNIKAEFHLPAGSEVIIKGMSANQFIPVDISALRLLVIISLLLLCGVLLKWKELHTIVCADGDKRQWLVSGCVVAGLIAGGYVILHSNPICIEAPWPHHKQYQELAAALSEGKVWLPFEPSEGLLAASNPYDTISLQADGIDYRADYAYYQGRYYVYFGIVPVLLFYLPYYLLTGKAFPNYAVVFLCYSGFLIAVFALYRELIRHFFRNTPYLIYLLAGILTAGCGNYLFAVARPDLYDTPIMAASMFTAAGLFFWIRGKFLQGMGRTACFAAGSLCMALVAGCRPQMVLFSALAIPLFWEEVIRERKLFSGKSVKETLALCLPYVIVAAGIMCYNGSRFSSPFDFGATYSLTSNDMTRRSFNLEQLALGAWHFFLQPPIVGAEFPFLEGNQIQALSYIGRLPSEYTYGGILLCNAFLWLLLFTGRVRAQLQKKGLFAFIITASVLAFVIGLADVSGAGILQRYTLDFIWGAWLAAVIVLFCLSDQEQGAKQRELLMRGLLAICLVQLVYGVGVVFGNGDLSVNVRSSNPALYYGVRALLRF